MPKDESAVPASSVPARVLSMEAPKFSGIGKLFRVREVRGAKDQTKVYHFAEIHFMGGRLELGVPPAALDNLRSKVDKVIEYEGHLQQEAGQIRLFLDFVSAV